MADITIAINGVETVLTDTGSGFNIDLSTSEGRAFLREELAQIREQKDVLVAERDTAELGRVKSIAQRDGYIDAKGAAIVSIDALNIRIDEIVAFLQGEGDPT